MGKDVFYFFDVPSIYAGAIFILRRKNT